MRVHAARFTEISQKLTYHGTSNQYVVAGRLWTSGSALCSPQLGPQGAAAAQPHLSTMA